MCKKNTPLFIKKVIGCFSYELFYHCLTDNNLFFFINKKIINSLCPNPQVQWVLSCRRITRALSAIKDAAACACATPLQLHYNEGCHEICIINVVFRKIECSQGRLLYLLINILVCCAQEIAIGSVWCKCWYLFAAKLASYSYILNYILQ